MGNDITIRTEKNGRIVVLRDGETLAFTQAVPWPRLFGKGNKVLGTITLINEDGTVVIRTRADLV